MKFKINYLIIPLVTILVSTVGSQITNLGMGWYRGISLPQIAPPGSVIGTVWTVIFILSTIAALLVYNRLKIKQGRDMIMILFLINAVLNVWWSTLFFGFHSPGLALIELVVLNLVNLSLLVLLWRKRQTVAAWLLLPYFLWVCFAGYLNFLIWQLN